MKKRLLFSWLGLALISVPGVRAEDPKPAAAAPAVTAAPAAMPEKPDTELEKTMSKMNKAWRKVRKDTRDGKLTPADATLVATVRTGAGAATKLTPALEADQPAADQAKFHADYLAQMKKLDEALVKLEAALTANDTAGATKLVGEVGEIMKAGHKEFKKPDEKH